MSRTTAWFFHRQPFSTCPVTIAVITALWHISYMFWFSPSLLELLSRANIVWLRKNKKRTERGSPSLFYSIVFSIVRRKINILCPWLQLENFARCYFAILWSFSQFFKLSVLENILCLQFSNSFFWIFLILTVMRAAWTNPCSLGLKPNISHTCM